LSNTFATTPSPSNMSTSVPMNSPKHFVSICTPFPKSSAWLNPPNRTICLPPASRGCTARPVFRLSNSASRCGQPTSLRGDLLDPGSTRQPGQPRRPHPAQLSHLSLPDVLQVCRECLPETASADHLRPCHHLPGGHPA